MANTSDRDANKPAHPEGAENNEAGARRTSMPNAGPHAKPELTNEDATPGAGTLPPVGTSDSPNSQSTG